MCGSIIGRGRSPTKRRTGRSPVPASRANPVLAAAGFPVWGSGVPGDAALYPPAPHRVRAVRGLIFADQLFVREGDMSWKLS